MPIFTPQEQIEFEERLFNFYLQVKDHHVNHLIPPLPNQTLEKFSLLKKKLGIKETI